MTEEDYKRVESIRDAEAEAARQSFAHAKRNRDSRNLDRARAHQASAIQRELNAEALTEVLRASMRLPKPDKVAAPTPEPAREWSACLTDRTIQALADLVLPDAAPLTPFGCGVLRDGFKALVQPEIDRQAQGFLERMALQDATHHQRMIAVEAERDVYRIGRDALAQALASAEIEVDRLKTINLNHRCPGDLLDGIEVARITAERDEYKTLSGIGRWHNDCRPNRHMAAREIAKSQAGRKSYSTPPDEPEVIPVPDLDPPPGKCWAPAENLELCTFAPHADGPHSWERGK